MSEASNGEVHGILAAYIDDCYCHSVVKFRVMRSKLFI